MDPPLALGLGNALHAVDPRLIAETPVGPPPPHGEDRFLDRPELPFGDAGQLDGPPAPFGEPAVHPHEVGAEEPRLVPPGPGADLDHGRAVLHRVRRHQRPAQRRDRAFHPDLQGRDLLLGQLLHLGISHLGIGGFGEDLVRVPELRLEGRHGTPRRDGGFQSGALPPKLAQPIEVAEDRGVGEFAYDGTEPFVRFGEATGEAGLDRRRRARRADRRTGGAVSHASHLPPLPPA